MIPNHIIADPTICHGKPIFRGTRVMVWQVLELLEAGETHAEIYATYPSLPVGSIEAALHYATERIRDTSYISFAKNATPVSA